MIKKIGCVCALVVFLACVVMCTLVVSECIEFNYGLHRVELDQVMTMINASGGLEAFVGFCRKVAHKLPPDKPFMYDKRLVQCDGWDGDSFFGLWPQVLEFEKESQCLVIQLSGGFAHKGIIVAIGDGAFKSGEIPNVGAASEQWNWKRIHQDVFWYSEIE